MIEDVEKCILCFGCCNPFLYVVDDKHVDCLIEVYEVVCCVVQHGAGVLHLEEACRDVEYALLGEELLGAEANGIEEMCFSAA